MKPLANLGLGERSEDFGGRKINDFMHLPLNRESIAGGIYTHADCLEMGSQRVQSGQQDKILCTDLSLLIERSLKEEFCQGTQSFQDDGSKQLVLDIRKFVNDQLRSLLRAFKTRSPEAFEHPIRWLFMVGGNTLVPTVEDFCGNYFVNNKLQRMPLLEPSERFLAVAKGATYAVHLDDNLYSSATIVLIVTGPGDRTAPKNIREVLLAKDSLIQDREISLPHQGQAVLHLRSNNDDLVIEDIGEDGKETIIEVRIQSRTLRVVVQTNGGARKTLYDGAI
jgi:hypothetical protein